jgi:hypothetical protein
MLCRHQQHNQNQKISEETTFFLNFENFTYFIQGWQFPHQLSDCGNVIPKKPRSPARENRDQQYAFNASPFGAEIKIIGLTTQQELTASRTYPNLQKQHTT